MKKKLILPYLILFAFSFLLFVPVVILFIWSVGKHYSWPNILPGEFTIDWVKGVMSQKEFYMAMGNTVLIGALTGIIGLLMALPIGKYLSKVNDIYSKILEGVLFLPILISPVVITLGLYKTFSILGLTGNIAGVVIAHLIPCLPYGIRIIKSGYENFDERYLDQARLLDASEYQVRLFVHLPMMWPSFLAGFHLMFLISMSQYILTLFVGNGRVQTLSTRMYPYLSGGNINIGAVYSLVFAFVAIILMFLLERVLNRNYKNN